MKRLIATSLGIAAIALGTIQLTQVRADTGTQIGSDVKPGHKHGDRGKKNKHIEALTTALGLTDDQVGKVKDIYKAQKTKVAIIKSDPALSPDDKRTKIAGLHKDTKQQLDAILTSDQQQKLRQFQKARRMARRERKGNDLPVQPAAAVPDNTAQ